MRIMIALGGNALLRRSDPTTTRAQRTNFRIAAQAIAPLAAEHSVVGVDGNGPQVGLLPLQAEAYRRDALRRRAMGGAGQGRAHRPAAKAATRSTSRGVTRAAPWLFVAATTG